MKIHTVNVGAHLLSFDDAILRLLSAASSLSEQSVAAVYSHLDEDGSPLFGIGTYSREGVREYPVIAVDGVQFIVTLSDSAWRRLGSGYLSITQNGFVVLE